MKYNLNHFFEPSSIAVIGASRDPNSVGQSILVNLTKGGIFQSEYCKPFKGRIYPVNPNAEKILGLECYPNLKSIDDDIDLAIVAVPPKIILEVIKDCITKKVRAIIVVTSGFSELGKVGEKMQEKLTELVTRAKIPMLGPNCLGILRPYTNLNASFSLSMPPEGDIAFISQSGAIVDSIIDWAIDKRYGFSALVSYGNKAVLDVTDFLEWFENDQHTKAIAIYCEGITDGRRFIEAAKKVSQKKPIVLIKAGRTKAGERAAASHTGSLAGSYEIYKAAFKQSNVFVADNIEELFDLSKALASLPFCRENSIGIVTNGGGVGVLCADYCEEYGVNIAELDKSLLKKLDKVMPAAYSRSNPLDIVGDALPDRYRNAINLLLEDKKINGLIVIQTLQSVTKADENAQAVVEARHKFPDKPIVCVFMGGRFVSRATYILHKNNIPNYNDVKKAVKAMKALIERKNQIETKQNTKTSK